jgi:hypothetical protein
MVIPVIHRHSKKTPPKPQQQYSREKAKFSYLLENEDYVKRSATLMYLAQEGFVTHFSITLPPRDVHLH